MKPVRNWELYLCTIGRAEILKNLNGSIMLPRVAHERLGKQSPKGSNGSFKKGLGGNFFFLERPRENLLKRKKMNKGQFSGDKKRKNFDCKTKK